MRVAPEAGASDPLRSALLSQSQQSYATQGPAFRHVYYTPTGLFAMSSSVVDGFLVLLDAPESDLALAFACICDGILLDRCIDDAKHVSRTKDYLGKIYQEEAQQDVVAAYARLLRTLRSYHKQRSDICCGSSYCQSWYEPRFRSDALRAINTEFEELEGKLRAAGL